jgi:glycosyltransferase involved in cell wall biosynthesis
MLKFSIVTPSFNQAKFIRETIESVLGQEYPSLEYIVIDGGSTDGTLDILRSYGNRLIWISEPDHGQADAINKGFRMANGDVFAWLNSDDMYLPGALKAVAAFFENNPSVGLVYGDALYVGVDGQLLKRKLAPQFERRELLRCCYIPQPAAFFRSAVWHAVGGLDDSLHHAFDWDLWLRMSQMCEIRKLAIALAAFRWHPQGKTFASAPAQNYEAVYIVRRRYVPSHPLADACDFALGVGRSLFRFVFYRLMGKV